MLEFFKAECVAFVLRSFFHVFVHVTSGILVPQSGIEPGPLR